MASAALRAPPPLSTVWANTHSHARISLWSLPTEIVIAREIPGRADMSQPGSGFELCRFVRGAITRLTSQGSVVVTARSCS